MTDPRLVALALEVADELDAPGAGAHTLGLGAGLLRRLARELVTGPELDRDRCPVCEAPVVQSGRGRPRVYCSRRCRDRAARRKCVEMRRCQP